MRNLKDLVAYQKSFSTAMQIFILAKRFPKEEKYNLTGQIIRSSRSVCSNLGEAYRKRIYPNHFISKLSDASMEISETQVWLEFAYHCKYINRKQHQSLYDLTEEVGKLLNYMISNPEKFTRKNDKN